MKKYFTGEITPPRKRVTTCQKCIRTPDIERVGKTARHGTYFEMLGNFSFGDYFKPDATAWAWEFCTKVLELPVDKLWVTIYLDDDEAFDIWTKEVGVSPDRIVRLGKEDNFWEHGTGPCGPCSEIYFDRGDEHGCHSPDCKVGCDCDRYVEFWNLVFTQFDSDGQGNYPRLEHPNIDTGMGLERLACIMQGVDNLFEVDTVRNIMKHIIRIAGIEYYVDEKSDVSLRVITDHIRSTTFMIGDGVMPSNEGRGYVLKRLLRRAARHGRLLGIERPFLSEVCDTVINENIGAYPNLGEKRDLIKTVIAKEEESFARTIDTGLSLLNTLIEGSDSKVLSGENTFKLYDTFGFPIDLTKEILDERGMTLDEDAFNALMKEQRDRARGARKKSDGEAWAGTKSLLDDFNATEFTGYGSFSGEAKVIAIVSGGELAEELNEGESGIIVLDRTPFYAESGGQIGDVGTISDEDSSFTVKDTHKSANGVFMHSGTLTAGEIAVGDKVTAAVNETTRLLTMKNHTTAHLLQSALRRVLGTHVEQAGQLVTNESVRFDFTHFSAMTAEEIKAVEDDVNAQILAAADVTCTEMPIDEAKKLGAMALFGEKYGKIVRVVKAGALSTELCGGTHIDNTAKIGLFKIVSEGSVAAGVRRIEGVTSTGVMKLLNGYIESTHAAAKAMKLGNSAELVNRAVQLMGEVKDKDREIEALRGQLAAGKAKSLFDNAKQIGKFKLITVRLEEELDVVRTMCDGVKSDIPDAVVLVAVVNKEKGNANFVCVCGGDAVKAGAHAGNIVREVAKLAGGSGGGRPDSAMAGVKNPDAIDSALAAAESIVAAL